MGKWSCQGFNEWNKENEIWLSISQVLLATIMVGIGASYLPMDESNPSYASATPFEKDPCPNGAANWLLVAGIVHLVVNSINISAKIYQRNSDKDNKIAGVVTSIGSIIILADIGMLIWGVVVVFWGFADWTGAGDDPEYDELYCDKVPMIAAVSILIIQKVIRKIILIASCWCAKYKPRYSEVEA